MEAQRGQGAFEAMTGRKTVYLIDGSNYVYRAFYAMKHIPTFNGLPTNAV